MGIEVPSSSPVTIAAELIDDEYHQKFIITDTDGVAVGNNTTPLVVQVAVTGYASTASLYQGTSLPMAGVYIADLSSVDFTEISSGQLATIRLNNRRAVVTATDGQATILTTTSPANYHDVLVTSGEFSPLISLDAPTTAFFQYTASNNNRYMYVPLSRGGWSKASVLISHDLTDSSSGSPVNLVVNIYGDFGQFDDNILLASATISGQAGLLANKIFTCYEPNVQDGSQIFVPAFNSPLAGIIVKVAPSATSNGNYSVYISKSA